MAGTPDWEVAVVQAATWGTAVAVGANTGLKIESESMSEGIPEPIKDENVGDSLSGGTYQGNVTAEGALVAPMRFLGPSGQLLMALLMGQSGDENGGASGAPEEVELGVAHAHYMYFQASNTGLFATVVIDKDLGDDNYYEYPTAKISGIEFNHNNGKLMGTFNMIANKCERSSLTNVVAAVGAVTHVTTGRLCLFNHIEVLIAEVDGSDANLDSDDEILVSDAKIMVNRNISGDHVSGSSAGIIDEPEVAGFPEATLEFTIPDYSTALDTLIKGAQAVQDGRVPKTYKATITWTGPDIPGTASSNKFSMQFDFPALTIATAPTNAGSPGSKVPVTIGFNIVTPQATPGGTDWAWVTAGTIPFRFVIQNSNSAAILA